MSRPPLLYQEGSCRPPIPFGNTPIKGGEWGWCHSLHPHQSVDCRPNFRYRSPMLSLILITFLGMVSPAFVQTQKPETSKTVRLYVFDCGTLDIPDTSPYRLKKEDL